MRFEIAVVALVVAAVNKRIDLFVALLVVGIPTSRYKQFGDFISGLYLTYTYWRLNHSIKAVLASKKELTQAHIDPIALRKWKEVLAWITFHPDELYLVDKKKQTVLHHCCLFRAPAIVIEMILFQAPDLVSKKNQDGEIPLNWAVRLSAPNEVLQLLLSADPASGCMSKDKHGNTALSIIWDRHADGLYAKWWNHGRDQIIQDHWWKLIIYLFTCFDKAANTHNKLMSNKSMTGIDEEGDSYYQIVSTPSSFLALHAATRCPGCPVSLFPVMIKVYHDQIIKKDDKGRIPLSVACLDPISNRSSGVSTKIQLLLSENRAGAESCDNDGRLPIFAALESGIVLEEGITDLLSAFPGCLQQLDPVTNLPPFLVAVLGSQQQGKQDQDVTVSEETSVSEDTFDESRFLTTIYTMLRHEPSPLLRHEHFQRTTCGPTSKKISVPLHDL
jgi:hypothetical protein